MSFIDENISNNSKSNIISTLLWLRLRSGHLIVFLLPPLLLLLLFKLAVQISLVGKMLQSWANIVFTYGTSSHWIESHNPSFVERRKKCEMEKVDVKWVTFDFWSIRAHHSTREKALNSIIKCENSIFFTFFHSSLRSLTSTAIFWQLFSSSIFFCLQSIQSTIDWAASHLHFSYI